MAIPGFISDLVGHFLDLLLPTGADKEVADKHSLGRYLLRTSALIDAYRFECFRLRRELAKFDSESDSEVLDSISGSFGKLAAIARTFGATQSEIAYLRLFDSEMYHNLLVSMMAEFGIIQPQGYVAVALQAEQASKSQSEGRIVELYDHSTAKPSGVTTKLDVTNEEDRQVLNEYIAETVSSLDAAQQRLSEFVSAHFKVWELFPARSEYEEAT